MAVRKELPSTEEIKAVFDELSKQTDRGAGIIAASVVEELLAVLIQARLLPLNSETRQSLFERPNAPLSTFSAKIHLGLALGLYSDVGAKRLHMMREVRNRFAHRIKALTFEHPDIIEVMGGIILKDLSPIPTNREKYLIVFSLVALQLAVQCREDIRISDLRDMHQDMFFEAVRVILPKDAEQLTARLRDIMQRERSG
jgi:hypothetical protein